MEKWEEKYSVMYNSRKKWGDGTGKEGKTTKRERKRE